MPNWTTNNLVIHKDDLHLLVNEEGFVDFNLLRPQPPKLVTSAWSEDEAEHAKSIASGEDEREWLEVCSHPLAYELADGTSVSIEDPAPDDWRTYGMLLLENERLYGSSNWYDWNTDHWGTKWNACNQYVGDPDEEGYVLVTFDTAWSQPHPLMMAELGRACSHPMLMESTYEGEDIVTGIDGKTLAPADVHLHLFQSVFDDDFKPSAAIHAAYDGAMSNDLAYGQADANKGVSDEALDTKILLTTGYLHNRIAEDMELIDPDGILTETQAESLEAAIVEAACEGNELRDRVADAVHSSWMWERLSDLVDDVVLDFIHEQVAKLSPLQSMPAKARR